MKRLWPKQPSFSTFQNSRGTSSFKGLAWVTSLGILLSSTQWAAAKDGHSFNTSADKTLADTYGCESQLSPDDEAQLIELTQQIDARHLAGKSTLSETNLSSMALESQLNPKHDPEIAHRLNMERNLVSVADTNKFLFSLLIKRLSGEASALTPTEKKLLLDRGVPAEVIGELDANLNDQKQKRQAEYNAMIAKGVKFDKEKLTWDFSDAHLNSNDFIQDGKPTVIGQAMENMVGFGVSKGLSDPNRTEAVIMGNKVFLPPIKAAKTGYKPGTLNTIPLAQWQGMMDAQLQGLQDDFLSYVHASKAGSTRRDLMSGGNLTGAKTKASEEQVGNKSIAQVTKDAAYQSMLDRQKLLSSLGSGPELFRSVNATLKTANLLDASNLDNAGKALDSDIKMAKRTLKLLAVTAGVATGGVLIGAVATGAAAGGATGAFTSAVTAATSTSSVATATGFMLTTPPLISGATSLARGMIDKDAQGGSLYCRFRQQFGSRAVGSFYVGSALAIVPGAAATGGAIFSAAGAPLAGAIFEGGANVTVGGVLTGSAAISGTKDLLGCYKKFAAARAMIKTAAKDGSSDNAIRDASYLHKEALEECIDAGVNLGTVMMATKGLTREGMKTLDGVYKKSPGFREFADKYVPLVKRIKQGLPVTAYESGLKVSKSQNTSLSEYMDKPGPPVEGNTRQAAAAEGQRMEGNFKNFMKDFGEYTQNVFRIQGRNYAAKFLQFVQSKPLVAMEASKAKLSFADYLSLMDQQYVDALAPRPAAPGPFGAIVNRLHNPTTVAVTALTGRTVAGVGKFGWGLLYYGTLINTFNNAASSLTNPINNKATQLSNIYLQVPALAISKAMMDSQKINIDPVKANGVIKEAEALLGDRKKFKFDGAEPAEVARYWVQMQTEILKINQEVTNILPGNINGLRGYKNGQYAEPADIGSQLVGDVLAYSVHETNVMELQEKIEKMKGAGITPSPTILKKLEDEKQYQQWSGDAVGGILVKATMNELLNPDKFRDPNVDNGQEVRNKAYDIVRNQAFHYPDYLQKFAPQTQALFDQLDFKIDVLKRALAEQQKPK